MFCVPGWADTAACVVLLVFADPVEHVRVGDVDRLGLEDLMDRERFDCFNSMDSKYLHLENLTQGKNLGGDGSFKVLF